MRMVFEGCADASYEKSFDFPSDPPRTTWDILSESQSRDAYATLTGVQRPTGIALTTILMAACNAMGWVIIDYAVPHARRTFVVFTVVILIGYVVLWAYWRGKNWARILVLISSVVTILNLRYWNLPSANLLRTPHRVMLASEFILGIFLLF